MKVLITGSNGLLGSNLVRQFLHDGFEVKAMVRENSNLLSLKDTQPEIIRGNLLHTEDIRKAIKGCKIIIHAAANTSQSPTGYAHYENINVDATRLLLEESLKAGVDRFIYVSSANAYKPGTKERPADETSLFSESQYQSGYIRSKYEAQKLALEFEGTHNLPVIVVNPTFMLGKYDAKPSSGQLLLMAHGKNVMPCPPGGKNFVHVHDVAVGIVNAVERGIPANSYLLGHKNMNYLEFFSIVKKVSGYPKKLIKLPKQLILSAGRAGSLCENISGIPIKLNRINASLICTNSYYSPEKAIRELQLPQTPIEQAIKDALEWFEENGYLK